MFVELTFDVPKATFIFRLPRRQMNIDAHLMIARNFSPFSFIGPTKPPLFSDLVTGHDLSPSAEAVRFGTIVNPLSIYSTVEFFLSPS